MIENYQPKQIEMLMEEWLRCTTLTPLQRQFVTILRDAIREQGHVGFRLACFRIFQGNTIAIMQEAMLKANAQNLCMETPVLA